MTTFLHEINTLLLHIGTLTSRNTAELDDALRQIKLKNIRQDVYRDYCIRFKSSDWTDLNNHGITAPKLRLISEKLQEFKKNFLYDIESDQDTPQFGIAAIFYKYFSSKARAACDELRTFINDDYQGDYKNLKFLSEHEWVFKSQVVVSLPILNPYSEVPRIISDIETFLDNTKEITDFNLSKFRYDQQFKLLRTFVDDIQNSNIEAHQKDILLVNWANIFLKSIFMFHIQMKIPTKEIMALSNNSFHQDLVEDQYDEALNTIFVLSLSRFLFDTGDIDSDEII